MFRKGCQPLAKPDDPSNSVGTFDCAMLSGIEKLRKQIARKHRFHEPHWPSLSQLPKTQPRRQTLDSKPTPQCGCREMLSLWLSPHAEPHGILSQRKQGRGLRHICKLRPPPSEVPKNRK